MSAPGPERPFGAGSVAALVADHQVLICCGSGGVGKTTIAAVLALEGARQGRNTCVITIDPAKRLISSGALEVVANAVPGMKDILVLGKVKSLDESRAADLIIVDAPAAGHAVSFLLSPRGLLDAVRVGPINKQAADVVALLTDPARCQVVLVTLPEETPVSELIETAYAIEDRAGVALGPVVVNQCFAPPPPGLNGSESVAKVLADAEACGLFVS